MKKVLVLLSILGIASLALADDPVPTPGPTVEGSWNLVDRACSSNTAPKDGLKIGTDTYAVTNNADKTFTTKMNIGGCETVVNGTYTVDGNLVTYTVLSSQGCKDAAPVPMNEAHSMYVAYLSDAEAVTVSTGDKAALSCPAGDALIMRFQKAVQP